MEASLKKLQAQLEVDAKAVAQQLTPSRSQYTQRKGRR